MKSGATAIVLVIVVATMVPARGAVITATWTGSGDGVNYSNPANWDVGVVPLNDPNTQYNVVIGTNKNVRFDIDNPGTVQDFALGSGSTFTVNPGHALTVADDSAIAGWIKVDNSAFTSTMPGAAFSGNTARLEALGGGDVAIAATTYSAAGLAACCTPYTIISVDGLGSTLDLHTLQSLGDGFNDSNGGVLYHRVNATNSATINLAGLQTITGPVRAEDYLEFQIKTGATVDLSGLQTINSAGAGYTRFNIDVPNFSLPSLTEASGVHFDLFTNGSWNFLSLDSLQNATINMSNGAVLSMPALVETSGGTWTWPTPGPTRAITTINAPSLVSMNGVALNLTSDGVLNAPFLSSFTGSSVALAPGRTFTVAPFVNIDNSRITVSGGATWAGLAPGASSYSSAGLNVCCGPYVLFSASGPSVLDLSPLTQISAAFNDNNGGATTQRIEALAGGVVDLSSVDTIVAPARAEDRLDLVIGSGGSILLSSLANVASAGAGMIRFVTQESATLALPALVGIDRTAFDLAPGSTLSIPAVQSVSNGTLYIPASGSVIATSLASLSGVTVDFVGGVGTLSAPSLTSFTGCVVDLEAGHTFSTPPLADIDNSRISVRSGVTWSGLSPGLTTYDSTALNTCCTTQTLFYAEGTGILDLAPLVQLNLAFNDNNGGAMAHRIEAAAGGFIDLSGVTTLARPARTEDRVEFVAGANARLDLGSLASIGGGGGQVTFTAQAQGAIDLGDLSSTTRAALTLADVSSRINCAGSLLLASDATLSCASGAELGIGGNFSFRTAAEANMNAQSGVMHFNAPGMKYLEVGGLDVGVPTNEATLNFGLGQLVVGDPNVSTVVQLLDVIDNGNRGPTTPEALYLYGLGGPDGLRIFGGSTLRLNHIKVYAKIGGAWTLLSSLFPQGEVEIPFDDGFIRRDAGTEIVGDCNCDGVVDFFDIDPFVAALGGDAAYYAQYPNCYRYLADIDGNRSVDFFDIDPLVGVFGLR